MKTFEQDDENYYYYGVPDLKAEEILEILGFHYDHNEFDEYGRLLEVWIKIK